MPLRGSPAVQWRRLGAELREIRLSRGATAADIAVALGWSVSKVSRFERAMSKLSPGDVARLLDYYEIAGPRRASLVALAEDAGQRRWWDRYADDLSAEYRYGLALEHEASAIETWHVNTVPGLLQTESYARRVISSHQTIEPIAPGLIDRLVMIRMRRQQLLSQEPALRLSVVLDESALLRQVGDRQIMHEQLQWLVRQAARPNVLLRVLPLQGSHTVFSESFVCFRAEPGNEDMQEAVSIEHLTGRTSIEGEKDAHLYRLTFQELAISSLDPVASKDRILEIAKSLWAASKRPGRST